MDLLQWLFDARIDFAGGQFLLLREVLGNVFGLLSALGGMRAGCGPGRSVSGNPCCSPCSSAPSSAA